MSADFDNDGWSDLLFIPYGNMSTYHTPIMYLNQQGKGFKLADEHGLLIKDVGATGAGADVIDYDKDGDLDLVTGNERGRWRIFENHSTQLNDNNFIGITVGNSPSGQATKFGAKVKVTGCGLSWIRQVGETSSSYAVAYNNDLLIGLGSCNSLDDISISWTNGETSKVSTKQVNTYVR